MGLLADYIMFRVRNNYAEQQQQKRAEQMASIFSQQPAQQGYGDLLGQSAAPSQDAFQSGLNEYLGQGQDPIAGLMAERQAIDMQPPMQQQPGGFFNPQMAQQLMQIPGMENVAAQLMNQGYAQDAAMQRQVQQQDFQMSEPYQAAELNMARMKARINAESQMAMNAYNQQFALNNPSMKDISAAENTLRDDYEQIARGDFDRLNKWSAIADQVNQAGSVQKMTNAQRTAAMKNWGKMVTGNEAWMSDDQALALAAQQFGTDIASVKSWLTGESPIGDETIADIIQSAEGLAGTTVDNLSQTNSLYTERAASSPGLRSSNIVRPLPQLKTIGSVKRNTMSSQAAMPGSMPPGVPDDLMPVTELNRQNRKRSARGR